MRIPIHFSPDTKLIGKHTNVGLGYEWSNTLLLAKHGGRLWSIAIVLMMDEQQQLLHMLLRPLTLETTLGDARRHADNLLGCQVDVQYCFLAAR